MGGLYPCRSYFLGRIMARTSCPRHILRRLDLRGKQTTFALIHFNRKKQTAAQRRKSHSSCPSSSCLFHSLPSLSLSHSLSLCLSICTSVTLSLTVRLAALASKLFVLARFSLLGFERVSHKIENHILPFICPPATFFMHFILSGYLHSPGGGSHREEIPAVIFGEVQFTNWRPCATRPHRSSDWRAYCCGSADCAGCAW